MGFFRRMHGGYMRFAEKQSFPIIATVCVAVITATALWTERRELPDDITPPPAEHLSAAQLLQESLREAATPTPAPAPEANRWTPPLTEGHVLCSFDAERMVQSGVTGIWALHDAVDLGSPQGSPVFAMGDGTVIAAGETRLLGGWIEIDHGGGFVALYAGMASVAAYAAGDAVRRGDAVGTVGPGPLDEADRGPHLHLRVLQSGAAVDPLRLWQTVQGGYPAESGNTR